MYTAGNAMDGMRAFSLPVIHALLNGSTAVTHGSKCFKMLALAARLSDKVSEASDDLRTVKNLKGKPSAMSRYWF